MYKKEALALIAKGDRKALKGLDMSGVFLPNVNLSGYDLENTDFRGANLFGCSFDGANLKGTNLRGAYMAKTNLDGSNLEKSVCSQYTNFKDAVFGNAKMPNIAFEIVDATKPIVVGDSALMSTQEWEENREHAPSKEEPICFGGSTVGGLLNVSPWISKKKIIDEKRQDFPILNPKNTDSFEAGHRMEDVVALQFKIYMEKQGHTVKLITETRMFQHPLHRWCLVNMDYLCEVDGELCILECKTVSYNRFKDIEKLKQGIPPLDYEGQVRTYLSVGHLMGIKKAYICLCWGFKATDDDMAVIPILRDEDLENRLLSALDEMAVKILEEDTFNEKDFDQELLAQYYHQKYATQEEEFIPVHLGIENLPLLTQVLATKEKISAKEEELAELNNSLSSSYNTLSSLFGTSTWGDLPISESEYYEVKKKVSVSRCAKLDVDSLLNDHPYLKDRYEKVVCKNPSEIFDNAGSLSLKELRASIKNEFEVVFDEEKFLEENLVKGSKSSLKAPFQSYMKRAVNEDYKAKDTFCVSLKKRKATV